MPPEVQNSASSTSPCAPWVAPPVDGPSRWTKAITTGVSVITAYWTVSIIRQKPGPEVAVIAWWPASDAPTHAASAEISSGADSARPPRRGSSSIIVRKISLDGVIG